MSRQKRALIARETLEILQKSEYVNAHQQSISIREALHAAKTNSILYSPQDQETIFARRDDVLQNFSTPEDTFFRIENTTTLHAVRKALDSTQQKVLCLNFASAKNPGGGFLNGSQAQEESLARASGLYPCIVQMEEMYTQNKFFNSCLYTDYMIYSPNVPVFRNDQDALLDQPYVTSIITAPAVNAGCIRQNEPNQLSKIPEVMRRRVSLVLSLAVIHGYRTVVLGAWGCGVFQNDPAEIAGYFYEYLMEKSIFKRYFQEIIFAILDTSKELKFINPFQQVFTNTSH